MRSYPEETYDLKELERLEPEKWMLQVLKKNPKYVHWGVYEDYMSKEGRGWDSRVIVDCAFWAMQAPSKSLI